MKDSSLLPALAAFAQVARAGNFSRAAKALDVSPSALSQTVRMLERKLGTRLLNRTTRDMSLTEAGRQLLETVNPSLAAIGYALRVLDGAGREPSGLLRINTSRMAATVIIEPHLAEFYVRHPKISLELVMDDRLSNIITEGCDAGIRFGSSLDERMIAVPVTPTLSMIVAAAPDYLARHGTPTTPADLTRHNCVNYRYNGSGALHLWEFTDPHDGHDVTATVAGNLTVNDDAGMTRAAIQGIGLIQNIDIAIRAELADGRLVQVLKDWRRTMAGFYLYAPSREHMPLKLRALIDFLVEKRETILFNKPMREL